ncbi:hypothetical protein GON26_13125 [Flavobacterium sp. GA093]|uniref:Uncharacterized protein n=1 Tax=Flavobacterium hydrocarbonoxydans TaxID=2683249 RepID=A0A6I4NW93_9FLAO|nr:hypothetical protein [Flavobacterium hydrocarbonoxydans]MWB95304.1 hypothetical protein [Flavobacterium hydrocarbonoxydans]
MKYFILITTFFFINFNPQENDKLNGRYNYLLEDYDLYVQKDKITFKDSVFVFDNKYQPKGKISYGNVILLENFINTDLIISISKDQIKKDTILFYMHDKRDGGNYLDSSTGKGKLIKIK